MTEFRRDPLTHRWVITGFIDSDRPEELIPTLKRNPPEHCHFCEGNEHFTPKETYAHRAEGSVPNRPGWDIRVVPNRTTDLRIRELQKRGQGGIYDLQNASGIHETIVETPKHTNRFSQLPLAQMVKVLKTYQDRYEEHKKNHLLKGVLIFRNQGRGGALVFEHTHSHMISLPFIPKTVENELKGAKRFYDLKTRCIFCDMVSEEKKINQRILYENDDYISWCPFAARFPFEAWIIGKSHQSEYSKTDPATFENLARAIRFTLSSIEKVVGDTPISFVIHSAPLRFDVTEDYSYVPNVYHWHIEILPHALPAGGFEWGGDFFLSPPTPERCAKVLKTMGDN